MLKRNRASPSNYSLTRRPRGGRGPRDGGACGSEEQRGDAVISFPQVAVSRHISHKAKEKPTWTVFLLFVALAEVLPVAAAAATELAAAAEPVAAADATELALVAASAALVLTAVLLLSVEVESASVLSSESSVLSVSVSSPVSVELETDPEAAFWTTTQLPNPLAVLNETRHLSPVAPPVHAAGIWIVSCSEPSSFGACSE